VSEIEIRPIDPHDRAAFDAWHAVYFAAERFGRERWASPWHLEEYRADRVAEAPYREAVMYSGVVNGEVVVVGDLEMPLLDRPDHALLEVFTHPVHRRRGYGSRMLVTLEVAARTKGRRIFDAETAYPYDGPADGAGSAGVEFARRHEYAFGLGDVMRVLDLPVAPSLLDSLLAEAAPHHPAYTLRSWVGHVPDDIVDQWVALNASLDTQAPTGELEKQEMVPDVDAQRAREAVMDLQQRTAYHTVAVAPDGRLAAYNETGPASARPRSRLPVGHARHPRAPRPPAGPRAQGCEPGPAPGGPPRAAAADDLQRRGEQPHDRHQRAAGLPAGRAAR